MAGSSATSSSRPPFDMPGHRWDPEKRRFFRIMPGQPSNDLGKAKGHPSHKSGSASNDVAASNAARPKETEGPLLPAISRTALPSLSHVHGATLDPVSIRSAGKSLRIPSAALEQKATETAYSQLVLFRARRMRGGSVAFFQTDMDSRSLLVLLDNNQIIRLSPFHGMTEIVRAGSSLSGTPLCFAQGDNHYWIKHGPNAQDVDVECLYIYSVEDPSEFPLGRSGGLWRSPSYDSHSEYDTAVTDVRRCSLYDTHGVSTYLAMAQGRSVVVATFRTKTGGFNLCGLKRGPRWSSDAMTVQFDETGGILYCGLRSGRIAIYYWRHPGTPEANSGFINIHAEGAVTNIATVSRTEIVVAWTNGDVRLINPQTSEILQTFEGHRNRYLFNLGFAVDSTYRLLALAGEDNRVRVWSLDSPTPLKSQVRALRPSFHAPKDSVNATHISWDESMNLEHDAEVGSALSEIEFPQLVQALHWNPRDVDEGVDQHELYALWMCERVCLSSRAGVDLFVGSGSWVYQFRWP